MDDLSELQRRNRDQLLDLITDATRLGYRVGIDHVTVHIKPKEGFGLFVWRDLLAVTEPQTSWSHLEERHYLQGDREIRDYLGMPVRDAKTH